MSNYLGMAKALDELMLELIKKDAEIPGNVTGDLRSGRSLAGIFSRQPCEGDTAIKTMSILENVEMNLLSLAETVGERDYAEKWQQKINDALMSDGAIAGGAIAGGASAGATCTDGNTPSQPASAWKYNSGVPRGEYWIRVKESELEPVSHELDGLLESFGLKALPQDDDYLLLYGKKENVSAFLKDIRDRERQRQQQRLMSLDEL